MKKKKDCSTLSWKQSMTSSFVFLIKIFVERNSEVTNQFATWIVSYLWSQYGHSLKIFKIFEG